MNDVIVVGAGPAGVSLALYLKRSNHKVVVISNNNSILKKAGAIENYYGFRSIAGDELYHLGIEQLKNVGVEVIDEEVVRMEKLETFKVYTNKSEYESKIVVIATGIGRVASKIPDISKYEGVGLSYCATCDGFFFREKKIGVIGNGNLAYEEAKHLMHLSSNVTLFTNGEELKRDFSDLNIPIITSKIKNIKGDTKVEGLILDNMEEIKLDGIFIALGVAGASSFSKTMGIAMNNQFIKVDEKFMTNIEGLYAIGDVIGGVLQIGKAVADGIIASKEISTVLRNNKDKS